MHWIDLTTRFNHKQCRHLIVSVPESRVSAPVSLAKNRTVGSCTSGYPDKKSFQIFIDSDICSSRSRIEEYVASVLMSTSGSSHTWAKGIMKDVTEPGWLYTNFPHLVKFLGVRFSRMWNKIVILLCSAKLQEQKMYKEEFSQERFSVFLKL